MKKPIVKLVGQDGNVFNIIGLISSALKKAGMVSEAKEFTSKAFSSESYDAVLVLSMEYCDVR